MSDVRKMIAEQIGLLVIANVEQQGEIAALRAELEKVRSHHPGSVAPENPSERK
jgi:hypothetical protein